MAIGICLVYLVYTFSTCNENWSIGATHDGRATDWLEKHASEFGDEEPADDDE